MAEAECEDRQSMWCQGLEPVPGWEVKIWESPHTTFTPWADLQGSSKLVRINRQRTIRLPQEQRDSRTRPSPTV